LDYSEYKIGIADAAKTFAEPAINLLWYMVGIKIGDYAVSKTIKRIDDIYSNDFYHVDVDLFWNAGEQRELSGLTAFVI